MTCEAVTGISSKTHYFRLHFLSVDVGIFASGLRKISMDQGPGNILWPVDFNTVVGKLVCS